MQYLSICELIDAVFVAYCQELEQGDSLQVD